MAITKNFRTEFGGACSATWRATDKRQFPPQQASQSPAQPHQVQSWKGARMNWRDAIGFALCDLIAVIAVSLALLEPSDKSYAYIFVAFAIIVYAFARTPNKHAKTKDASMPITLDLTFCENTPKNRKRCLRPGHLYLTIYPRAKNISRSIYRGEDNPQWGWSGYDTQPFTSHIPIDGPVFFTEGEVENIPGFPG